MHSAIAENNATASPLRTDLPYRFIGWVPVASGYLSFTNIKAIPIPGRAKPISTVNCLGEPNGFLSILQERDLCDRPGLFALGDNGRKHAFLLLARDETSGERLQGMVVAGPRLYMDAILNIAEDAQRAFQDKKDIATIEQSMATAVSAKSRDGLYLSQISVERNGVALIRRVTNLPQINSEFVEECGVAVRAGFEVFSFLKDVLHAHKFHKFDDDAIVGVHPYDGTSASDQRWRMLTAQRLHDSVVVSARSATYQGDLVSAKGRLTYLRACLDTLFEGPNVPSCQLKRPAIDCTRLESSLEAKLAQIKLKEDRSSVVGQAIVALMVSFFGIAIASAQLLQIPCIAGLSWQEATCTQVKFRLDEGAVSLVQLLLGSLVSIPGAGMFLVAGLLAFTFRRPVNEWAHEQHGERNVVGGLLRLILGASISTGRALASVWIAAFFFLLVFLFYIAATNLIESIQLTISR
jgi:hypothetical protein